MAENNVYLIWSGIFLRMLEKRFCHLPKQNLMRKMLSQLRRKVFSILVEILENVAKYSPGKEPEEKFGMPVAMIRLEDKSILLQPGNLILNENVEHLKEKTRYHK